MGAHLVPRPTEPHDAAPYSRRYYLVRRTCHPEGAKATEGSPLTQCRFFAALRMTLPHCRPTGIANRRQAIENRFEPRPDSPLPTTRRWIPDFVTSQPATPIDLAVE